jgi:hypothetical protein
VYSGKESQQIEAISLEKHRRDPPESDVGEDKESASTGLSFSLNRFVTEGPKEKEEGEERPAIFR